MRIILWIVRALAILILLRLVLRMIFGSRTPARGQQDPRSRPKAPERLGGELVRDPNCGTYIPKARAIVVGSGDAAVYFCSNECREAYDKVRNPKSEARSSN